MSKAVKGIKVARISNKDMSVTLERMEKIVDEKLAGQKVLAPILLTVITSIIAFLFVNNLGDSLKVIQLYLMVFAYALVCFSLLVITLLKESSYKEIIRKTKKPFSPHRLGSYCYLSDVEFKKKISTYAGRRLTYVEELTVDCIKQKVNEYAHKKKYLNLVLYIILVGALLLALVCVLGVYILPDMPQYSGGTL